MHTRRYFNMRIASLAVAGLTAHTLSCADDSRYPSRPIKIIVPFAPGGGPDILTRRMAIKLATALGTDRVVVDNIVGAGGVLAAQSVARMAPDGYNLLLGSSTHLTQKAMQPGVKFDPLKDFAPISLIGVSPSILVVSADSPYQTVQELVAAAKSKPGELNYASGGVGSAAHLSGAAMLLETHVDAVHVPYKGSVEIVPSIISGATQFGFPTASTAIPMIKAGKVRALAVTSAERLQDLPQVPTLEEVFRAPNLVLTSWSGLWAPTGTPKPVIDILFNAIHRAFEDPALRTDYERVGVLVMLSKSPQEFRTFMESETVKFDRIVKAANLSITQ